MGVRRWLLLSFAALVAACAAPQEPLRRTTRQAEPYERGEAGRGTWGDRILVEPMVIPAAWLQRDRDGGATAIDAGNGFGYGLRGAVGNRDQSIGLLYQGLHTDEDEMDVHALGLDVDVRRALDDGTDLFFVKAGVALGGCWLDVVADDTLSSAAMAQLRLGIEFQPTSRFALDANLGGVVFGHPGETEVYGTFLTIGAVLVF